MTAAYPQAIRSWTQHHDYTDDILAAHVNDLQDEVSAIDTVLGTMPHNDSSLTSGTTGWTSVKARLKDTNEGALVDCFEIVRSTSQNIKPGLPNTNAIIFTAPSATYDPFSMWNGAGVTIKRTGWYNLSLWAVFNYSSSVGYREVGIQGNGGWIVHETQTAIIDSDSNPGMHLNCVATAVRILAGTRLVAVARHGAPATLQLATARLSGHFVRAG